MQNPLIAAAQAKARRAAASSGVGLAGSSNPGFFSGLLGSINQGLTNVRGRLAAVDAGERFADLAHNLRISEQKISAKDLANYALAEKYRAEAKAERATAGREAAFRQLLPGIEEKRKERERVSGIVAERAARQQRMGFGSAASTQKALLGTPLGASAFHGAMPSGAQPQPSRARDMASFAPPSNVEQLLVAGGGGGISPFPGQAGPIAHQTPGYMNQDYIKNLLGPTTAESQAMAYNPEREYL